MKEKTVKKPASKKAAKQAKPITYVAVVLDESGSMNKGKEQTMSGFNEQLDVIRKMAGKAGDVRVTLVPFSTAPRVAFANCGVDRLVPLTDQTYHPDGMTALYDAIWLAVEQVRADKDSEKSDSAVLMVIVTDGEENSSHLHNATDVAELKQEMEKTGRWTFTFMGPNTGLKTMADLLKIEKGNLMGFDPGSVASRGDSMAAMTAGTALYLGARSRGVLRSQSFYSNKDEGDASAPA